MSTAVSTEMRKFFSTRLWWVLLLIMAGYMAFLAAVLAFSITQTPQEVQGDKIDVVRSIYTVATSLGYVFPAIVGTLAVTSEFRHRTIVPTLLTDPSRTRLITAKMIAAAPIGLLFGIVGTVACIGAGAGTFALTDVDPLLGSPEVWRSAALSVVALTVWSVVGVGLGAMLPNQVASLVTLLAFTQFVEPVARMALPAGGAPPGARGRRVADRLVPAGRGRGGHDGCQPVQHALHGWDPRVVAGCARPGRLCPPVRRRRSCHDLPAGHRLTPRRRPGRSGPPSAVA